MTCYAFLIPKLILLLQIVHHMLDLRRPFKSLTALAVWACPFSRTSCEQSRFRRKEGKGRTRDAYESQKDFLRSAAPAHDHARRAKCCGIKIVNHRSGDGGDNLG